MQQEGHTSQLNAVQQYLLQLFSFPMGEEDLIGLKKILLDYYDLLISQAADKVWTEKKFTPEKLQDYLNTHPNRIPYEA